MDFSTWSDQIVNRLVKAGFEYHLVEKVFNEARVDIEREYSSGELSSAAACFIEVLRNYDTDLMLVNEREAGRRSIDIGKMHGMPEKEARAGWRRGAEKKRAILSLFRGDKISEAENKRKVLYYLPLIRLEEDIKVSGISLKAFSTESEYGNLLPRDVFDGQGAVIEVEGFKSGDFFNIEVDSKIYEALEKLKFGFFYLTPPHSGGVDGYVSSETFECFRVIEDNPDNSFEHKVQLSNGMFDFYESLKSYYQYRTAHQQKPVKLSAFRLSCVSLLTDGLNSPSHMLAIKMYNRCWSTYSIHSHFDKALLAKVSIEILLGSVTPKKIKPPETAKVFCDLIELCIEKYSLSSRVVLHIKEQSCFDKDKLREKIDENLLSLKVARDDLSHKGVVNYSHINIPFYLVWFPLFWLLLFCESKLSDEEAIRFSLFCGLMNFDVDEWQSVDVRDFPMTKSHLQIYEGDARCFPRYLKRSDADLVIESCLESVTRWLRESESDRVS